jgi:fibronectin-binding autotransporter adhesin
MNRDTFRIDRDDGSSRSARGPKPGARRRDRRRLGPVLLELEGRRLLSQTFTVTNTADSGPGSLPYEVVEANGAESDATVDFDARDFATPQTITLGGGALELSDPVGMETITGPAAGVTISGGGTSGVFEVESGVTATLSGLTITDGRVAAGDYGGGVFISPTANLSLTGCTISGSSAESGGGLFNTGTTTLTDCTLSGNSAGFGGGLNNKGTANLADCTLSGNSGGFSGGLLNQATTTLTDCTLSGNSAGMNGGGMSSFGPANLIDCTLSGNSASKDGGGLANFYTANLIACTVSGNTAGADGGGLYINVTAYMLDTIVAGNVNTGGGPDEIYGTVTGRFNLIGPGSGDSGGLTDGQDDNQVLSGTQSAGLAPLGDYGGPTQTIALLPGSPAIGHGTKADLPGTSTAIADDQRGFPMSSPVDVGAFQTGHGLVVNTTIDGPDSPSGEMSLRQAVDLADVLDGNAKITFDPTAFSTSQRITLTQGQLELSDPSGTEVIDGPTAGVTISGGGTSAVFQVDTGVTASILGLTITDGSQGSGSGGGLDNEGTTYLYNCTISGNSAKFGGGLDNSGSGQLTLTDCTISGNTAAGHGGGLDNGGSAHLTLIACTVGGNTAATKGGGLNTYGTTGLTDTIVAGDVSSAGAPDDISGTVSGTFNLIGTGGAGGLTDGQDHNVLLSGTETPGLAPLGDYGGPTQTIALLPGSPAIGNGTKADYPGTTGVIAIDQRGSDLDAPAPDIGSFQSQGFTLTAVSGGTPQSATIGTAFAAPLSVQVTAKDPEEPVAGGVISFTLPSAGASAALSGVQATIGTNGEASVTAAANSSAGSYTVSASIPGTTAAAEFHLTNLPTPTPTPPSPTPPSPTPPTPTPPTPTPPTPTPPTPTSTPTSTPSPTSPTLTPSAGSAVFGQSVMLSATVSSSAGVTTTGTITFFDGATDLGIVALNGSGDATLTTSSLAIGANPITASYSGDGNFTGASSAQAATVSVAQAATQIELIPMGPYRGRSWTSRQRSSPWPPATACPPARSPSSWRGSAGSR